MWTVGLFVYAACVVKISSAQVPWFVDNYEGSPCKTPNGALGVCKERDDCLVTLSSPVPVSEDPNGRALCGSVGPNALVCCDSRPPHADVVTTTAQVVTSTEEQPRTPVGDKSAKYCLSIISSNHKEPWWTEEGYTQENNEIAPWWEEEKQTARKQLVYWANGGMQTNHREFPHMALLGYRLPGHTNTHWRCAGALISDRFVLTAAHCLTDGNLKTPTVVRLGEHDLTTNDRTEQDFGIENTWLHPKEGADSWYHDIALIRLDRQVKFSQTVSPGCLYSSPEGQARQDGLVVSGWGMSANDDWPGQVLLKSSAPLRVVPRNECAKYYRQATQVPKGIHPGMVCAVGRSRYVGTCQGDSGGPIQLKTSFDVYAIVGVSTCGVSNCGDGTPSIYTRVAYYLDWIENIVWPNEVDYFYDKHK